MPDLHHELEVKYDLDGSFELPDLTELLDGHVHGGAVREHRLEATYFDTDDHALAAARITLRRRRGGADAGWHLKLPGTGGARQEVRLPLGRAARTVPAPLQALVWSRTLGAPLAPVATISTRRTEHELRDGAGRVLAEVADDRVEARRVLPLEGAGRATGAVQSWRELEVELVEGDRELLEVVDRRLRSLGLQVSASASKLGRVLGSADGGTDGGTDAAAGRQGGGDGGKGGSRGGGRGLSPKSTAGAVVLAHLAGQVEQIRAQDPQVRLDAPDSVHKMRVATRRLRSALRTFRPLLPEEVTGPLREELKWLAARLGEARDAEVMRERLLRAVAAEDPALLLGEAGRGVDAPLSQAYARAHEAVVAELDGERYRELLRRLHALVTDPPLTGRARRKARDWLPGRVAKTYAALEELVRRAERTPPGPERDDLLHEARKAAKQARYAAESVAVVFGEEATAFAEAVEEVQEVLGEHQDSVVTRQRLQELAEGVDSPAAAFALGRLHALEESHGRQAEERFAGVWAAASRKSLRRWLG